MIAFILKYEMFYNGEMAFGLYQVTKMICNELQLVNGYMLDDVHDFSITQIDSE